MATRLDEILAHTRLQVQERKAAAVYSDLERKASGRNARGFAARLREAANDGTALIAELKKASPSKGLIRESFDPVALAQALAGNGAAALSVLTEERFFQGSLGNLQAASRAVAIPLLRKDFIVDGFQILEAKAFGADAVLLIVAALSDRALGDLGDEARRWGLDVLCEAHDRQEIDRAVQLGFDTIGVNSRNLKTLEVRSEGLIEMAEYLPGDAIRVAESGIRSRADVERLLAVGYNAFLVGETLMRESDPGAQLRRLLGSAALAWQN